MSASEEVVNLSANRDAAAQQAALPHSLPLLNLNAGRDAILAYFENTWALTEQLFSALASDEAYYQRPWHKTRHPLIFYYAHPVCFYVNKLLVAGLINEPVNQEFELLFETGVDEMNWDDLHEGENDIWPQLSEVREYRQQVFDLVHELIRTHPILDQPITMDSPAWALPMAFEHERIHLETSSVLIRELPLELLRQPDNWPPLHGEPASSNYQPQSGEDYPRNEMLPMDGAEVRLGKPEAWPSYGWDNEYGNETRQVDSFKVSKFLVSNGEFFEFVSSGGYEQKRYWSEDGWAWRQFRNVKWPTFWVQDGPAGSHRYKLRTTFSEIPMPWDWPAVVNYYEAKAYCAWLGEQQASDIPFRLLTEAEHHVIREPAMSEAVQWTPGDNNCLTLDPVMQAGSASLYNHNLRYGAETPVHAMAANSLGIHDSFGNVWQWCEDPFHPLAGFEIHPYYTDFSTPCFDDEHQMILGGSFISTGDEASLWSRFHFRPHFYQHAGFRLVQDQGNASKKGDKYDSDDTVDQYLLFHFADRQEQRDAAISAAVGHPDSGDLIQRTVELVNEYSSSKDRVLDLGCAVGRASFELARSFEQVLGLDYSDAFIDAARQIKQQGSLEYRRRETGRHSTAMLARVPEGVNGARVNFVQGDAARLKATPEVVAGGPFDALLLSNLLCRLSRPEDCLRQFVTSDSYIKSGGILVIASPNTWMEEFTGVDHFLDGPDSDATLAAIGRHLPGFTRLHAEDLPFMIREHRRKYEYIISQVSVWRKD